VAVRSSGEFRNIQKHAPLESFEQVSAGEYYQTLIMSSLNLNQAMVRKKKMMGFVVAGFRMAAYRGG
jgi:hypothetical protein